MSVIITALLDQATLTQIFSEVTPLDIDLGEGTDHGRWLSVGRARRLEIVHGRGVRLETSAKVSWTVAGVTVPITIHSVAILLELSIGGPPDGGRLIARPRLESADLKGVPALLDRKLVERVNERLAAQPPVIGWSFAHTLTHAIKLPDQVAQLSHFELGCADARLEIDAQAIRLSLALPMHFKRKD